MNEIEFWGKLRIRINQCSASPKLGWCDWFEPRRYKFYRENSTVEGRVGFVNGADAHKLNFALHIRGRQPENAVDIDWEVLLPAELDGDWFWWVEETLHIELGGNEGQQN